MKKFYFVILFVLLIFEAPALAVDVNDITKDISKTYIQFRNALSSENYEQYKSLFIPKHSSRLPNKTTFKKHSKSILDFYPDLSNSKITRVINSGNCYGIIFIEESIDLGEENINLVLIRFKKTENKWKVSGHIGIVGFNKFGSKAEIEKRINKEIEQNENLKSC